MACKDTSVAKERILNKKREFENIKKDIYSILQNLTDNVEKATSTVLDKSITNSRRQFRSSYAHADQTIETCLLKLMNARANLQNENDDDTGSDHSDDLDCKSSISSDFIKLNDVSTTFSTVDCVLGYPPSSDRLAESYNTSTDKSKCASPILVPTKRLQQPHSLPSVSAEVDSTRGVASCLNGNGAKDVLCNDISSLPSQELTMPAESPSSFWNIDQCTVSSGQCKSTLPQWRSIAEKQFMPTSHADQPALFDSVSDKSEATITNSGLATEDALTFDGAAHTVKHGSSLISNHHGKCSDGVTQQFKDLNLDELVNTLAHLTEPKDSEGSLETERFIKHVQNIYKHVAPGVSGAIDKVNQTSLIRDLSESQGTAEPLAVSSNQFTSCAKTTCIATSSNTDLCSAHPAYHCNAQSNKEVVIQQNLVNASYNFEPITKSTATTSQAFSSNVLPHTDQLTQDISQSFPMVNEDARAVQAKSLQGKVAPGFTPIKSQSDWDSDDCEMNASDVSRSDVSTYPVNFNSVNMAFSLPRLQYDEGSAIIASVEHVNSPSSFYIRPVNNDSSLEDLKAELSKCYDGSYRALFTDHATVGLTCCALSYCDNSWYRAVITVIHRPLSPGYAEGSVTVRFVDKGVTEQLPLFRLRHLDESFLARPCLVVHCTLHNAKPPLNQSEWSAEQIETFTNLACRNDIKAKVCGKLASGELVVDLITLEKCGSETVEVSILDCFVNAACCSNGINDVDDDTPRASPVQLMEPAENNNFKISFTIKSTKKPLLDTFIKKKRDVTKSKRLYRTSRVSNENSDSDTDKTVAVTPCKPPMCWEDLDNQSSSSSIEKIASTSSNEVNVISQADPAPFPTIPNIQLNLSNYSYQDAMIAHVVSPSEFYIHPVVEEATYIDELNSDLTKTYAKAQAPLAIVDSQSIPIGSFWCAKFPENGLWYRAKVVDVKEIEDLSDKLCHDSKKKKKKLKTKPTLLESKFHVNVFYIDHGNSAWIESNDLRHLKKKFYKHPALAVRCSLMGVYPKNANIKSDPSSTAWPPEAAKALESWADDKTIRIQVFNAKDYETTRTFEVLLWYLENEECLFNEEIVKRGLADSTMCFTDKKQETQDSQKAGSSDDVDYANMAFWDPMTSEYHDLRNSYAVDVDDAGVALTGYKARDESEICMFYQRGQLCKHGSNCRYKHVVPPMDGQTTDKKAVMGSGDLVTLPSIGSCVAVDVTAILNAAHFYVNFPYSSEPLSKLKEEADCEVSPKKIENLTTLQTKMQSAYKSPFCRDGDYLLRAEGEIVVARFSQDNEWYRAQVIRLDPDGSRVKVFYVDYGNCEWVSEKNVRDIRPEFMHYPFQAVECHLANIELITSEENEKKDARAFFQAQIESRNLVAHIKDIVGNTLYLELFYTENETDVNINLTLVSMDYAKLCSGMKRSSSPSKKLDIMPA